MVKKYNNILIEFGMIFDTDLGMLLTIQEKYNNPKYMDSEYINNANEDGFIYELLNQETYDPLNIVLLSNINKKLLYQQFNKEEYDTILKYSKPTNIANLIQAYIESGAVNVTVLCKNEKEKQYISKRNINSILEENIDMKLYDCIYVKNIESLLKIKGIKGKNIFIGNYRYNFDNEDRTKLKENIVSIFGLNNKISIIDVYNKLNIIG